jgi:hypothetical protein
MKTNFLCLSIFLFASSVLGQQHQTFYKVSKSSNSDCCLLESPILVEIFERHYSLRGLYADSAACQAAKLVGKYIASSDALNPVHPAYFEVGLERKGASIIASTITTVVSPDKCYANLTAINITLNFTGTWIVTPFTPSNKSQTGCCLPPSFNIARTNKSRATISGSWPATDSCKKFNYVGNFSLNLFAFDVLSLHYIYNPDETKEKVYLQRGTNKIHLEWAQPSVRCYAWAVLQE